MIFLFVSSVYAHNIYVSTKWGFGMPAYGSYVKFDQPQIFDTFNRSSNFLFFDNYGIRTTSNMLITSWFIDNWLNYTTTAGTQDISYGTEPSAVYFDDVTQTKDDTWSYSGGVTTITPSGTDVGVFFGEEFEVNDYVINLADQKLFAFITYKNTDNPVSDAFCSFVAIQKTTNSSGWAEWDMNEFPNFDYNTAIIIADYPDNDLAVPLAKQQFIIHSLQAINLLTDLRYDNYKFYWSATGTGLATFQIFSIDNPFYLKIDGVTKMEGDSWSKSGPIITVNDFLGSTHDYMLSFSGLIPPPNPPTPNDDDDLIPEPLVEIVDDIKGIAIENLGLIIIFFIIFMCVIIVLVYRKYIE